MHSDAQRHGEGRQALECASTLGGPRPQAFLRASGSTEGEIAEWQSKSPLRQLRRDHERGQVDGLRDRPHLVGTPQAAQRLDAALHAPQSDSATPFGELELAAGVVGVDFLFNESHTRFQSEEAQSRRRRLAE